MNFQQSFNGCILSVCMSADSCGVCRCKYHRLKYGTELEQGDMIPPKFEKELTGWLCDICICVFLLPSLPILWAAVA